MAEYCPSQTNSSPPKNATSPASDDSFTVKEIAARWKLSRDFVRRIFEREPGVLIFTNGVAHRRRYRTLRIPKAVLERVEREHTLPAPTDSRRRA